jgi:hypothetical protein
VPKLQSIGIYGGMPFLFQAGYKTHDIEPGSRLCVSSTGIAD